VYDTTLSLVCEVHTVKNMIFRYYKSRETKYLSGFSESQDYESDIHLFFTMSFLPLTGKS